MFGNMQARGRIGFLLIPFLCSSCNIIPRTQFVNPDFPISQFLSHFQHASLYSISFWRAVRFELRGTAISIVA